MTSLLSSLGNAAQSGWATYLWESAFGPPKPVDDTPLGSPVHTHAHGDALIRAAGPGTAPAKLKAQRTAALELALSLRGPRVDSKTLAQELKRTDGAKLIEASTLAALLERVGAKIGTAEAERALLDILAEPWAERLSDSGVDFVLTLQRRHHWDIDRLQSVVSEMVPGAKLLHRSRALSLTGDLLFQAEFPRTVETVGRALGRSILVSAEVVRASAALARCKPWFASGTLLPPRYSPRFWSKSEGDGAFAFAPRSDVTPASAIRDIFKRSNDYWIDCADAVSIVYYKAILEIIGDAAFDSAFGKTLRLGSQGTDPRLEELVLTSYEHDGVAPKQLLAQLRPGDYVYIKNWDVSGLGRAVGLPGENMIYVGGGKFYGHPFGIVDADTVIAKLNLVRPPWSRTSASFESAHQRLSNNVVRLARPAYDRFSEELGSCFQFCLYGVSFLRTMELLTPQQLQGLSHEQIASIADVDFFPLVMGCSEKELKKLDIGQLFDLAKPPFYTLLTHKALSLEEFAKLNAQERRVMMSPVFQRQWSDVSTEATSTTSTTSPQGLTAADLRKKLRAQFEHLTLQELNALLTAPKFSISDMAFVGKQQLFEALGWTP